MKHRRASFIGAALGGSALAVLSGLSVAIVESFLASPAFAQYPTPSVFSPLPDAPKLNEARARLGAMLFFDTRLSGDTGHNRQRRPGCRFRTAAPLGRILFH